MSRAVGELLERYFLSVYRRSDLRNASFDEMRAHGALDIFGLNGHAPWQIEQFRRFERSGKQAITWVQGKELLSGRKSYIPAQLVYWNYTFLRDEMILAEPNTNGAAGHFTLEKAILGSLLENIQRDGFLMYWLNSIAPKRIDVSTIVDQEIKNFLLYLRRYRLEYHFLNTTTDIGVPSCVCVLIDTAQSERPIIALGGSAGFSLKELILQSAGEALSIHDAAASGKTYVLPSSYKPFSDPKVGREQRLFLWQGPEMHKRFDFFLKGPPQSFEGFMGDAAFCTTPEQQLAYILGQFKKLGSGYEVHTFEVLHPVLKELGFHVVRTVVPRLMHLYLNERMATLDAPRLREVPPKLGYTAAQNYNSWPHPFP